MLPNPLYPTNDQVAGSSMSSPWRGVALNKLTSKWRATIRIKNKTYTLSEHDSVVGYNIFYVLILFSCLWLLPVAACLSFIISVRNYACLIKRNCSFTYAPLTIFNSLKPPTRRSPSSFSSSNFVSTQPKLSQEEAARAHDLEAWRMGRTKLNFPHQTHLLTPGAPRVFSTNTSSPSPAATAAAAPKQQAAVVSVAAEAAAGRGESESPSSDGTAAVSEVAADAIVSICHKQPDAPKSLWCKSCRLNLKKRCTGLKQEPAGSVALLSSSSPASSQSMKRPASAMSKSNAVLSSPTSMPFCSSDEETSEDMQKRSQSSTDTGSGSSDESDDRGAKRKIRRGEDGVVEDQMPEGVIIDDPASEGDSPTSTAAVVNGATEQGAAAEKPNVTASSSTNGSKSIMTSTSVEPSAGQENGSAPLKSSSSRSSTPDAAPRRAPGRAAAAAAMEKMASPQQQQKTKYRPDTPSMDNPSSSGSGSSGESSSKNKAAKVQAPKVLEEQQWVQCEACNKWRAVPSHINAAELPDIWCVLI